LQTYFKKLSINVSVLPQCKQQNSGTTLIGGFASASRLPHFYIVVSVPLRILGNSELVMRLTEVG